MILDYDSKDFFWIQLPNEIKDNTNITIFLKIDMFYKYLLDI